MRYFIDVAYDSLNKYNEELCGDKVEVVRIEDGLIIVLADGLGSGVKANILATITAKIAATLLKGDADIYETVDTIVNTLPVCKVRNIAYCTFTIIKVFNDGKVYMAEYDNPPVFFISDCDPIIDRKETVIGGRVVKESNFTLNEGDILTVVSDGAIHAGVGNILNLGWQWDNVNEYLKRKTPHLKSAIYIAKDLIEACNDLYSGKPGDDTTVVTVKMRRPEVVDLFTGPPLDSNNDTSAISQLMRSKGKKIICGGTAANIAARELHRELKVNLDFWDNDVPPTGTIEGFDLITEGVITLSKTVEKIKNYSNSTLCNINGEDGASQLTRILLNDCTHINFFIGKAMNPAHQNQDFPIDLSKKLQIVDELIHVLEKLGKATSITYV